MRRYLIVPCPAPRNHPFLSHEMLRGSSLRTDHGILYVVRVCFLYTPKTNGKADRSIQTALRERAYARAYHNFDQQRLSQSTGCIATIGIGHVIA